MTCPTQPNSICWGWSFNQSEMQKTLQLIFEARAKCFPRTNNFGMIRFSKGGYLVTQWYRNALTPKINNPSSFFIALGSDRGVVPQMINSLATNPPLTLVIGNQDLFNRDPTDSFYNQLKALGTKVDRIEFNGEHQLDLPSLNSALNTYMHP